MVDRAFLEMSKDTTPQVKYICQARRNSQSLINKQTSKSRNNFNRYSNNQNQSKNLARGNMIAKPVDLRDKPIKNESPVKLWTLVSGSISGVVSRTFVAPAERIIIMKQTKAQYIGDNFLIMLLNMYKREGISSWYKGNWANCVRIAPFQAIEFFFFDCYRVLLSHTSESKVIHEQSENKVIVHLLAGALAGATATAMVYPLDMAKTHLAINVSIKEKTGVFGTLKRIIQREGLRGLYKGLGASVIGISPYASLKLTFYNQLQLLRSKVKKTSQKNLDWKENILLGGFSGCMAVTATYPTDLIRRRIQVLKLSQNQNHASIISVIKGIYRADGFKGFYFGLTATYIKLFPSTALAFSINDALKKHQAKITSLKF